MRNSTGVRRCAAVAVLMLAGVVGCGSDDSEPMASGGSAGQAGAGAGRDAQAAADGSSTDVQASGDAARDAGRDATRDAGREAAETGAGPSMEAGVTTTTDSATPSRDAESGAPAAVCGNGKIEGNETCDDGTTIDKCRTAADGGVICDDACSPVCTSNTACNACMEVECPEYLNYCENLSDGTASGQARVALCHNVYACVARTGCANPDGGGELNCYCGRGVNDTVCSIPGGASGPCKKEIEDALDTDDPVKILNSYTDVDYPLGPAMNKVFCEYAVCGDTCYYGRFAPAKAGTGSDAGADSPAVVEASLPDVSVLVEAAVSPDSNTSAADARTGVDAAPPGSSLPVNAACEACERSRCFAFASGCSAATRSSQGACFAALDCGRRVGCHTGALGPLDCYCGTATVAGCSTGTQVPNGACNAEMTAAAGSSADQAIVYRALTDNNNAAGIAFNLLECDHSSCAAECVPYVR